MKTLSKIFPEVKIAIAIVTIMAALLLANCDSVSSSRGLGHDDTIFTIVSEKPFKLKTNNSDFTDMFDVDTLKLRFPSHLLGSSLEIKTLIVKDVVVLKDTVYNFIVNSDTTVVLR